MLHNREFYDFLPDIVRMGKSSMVGWEECVTCEREREKRKACNVLVRIHKRRSCLG